ncbi:hypothetical protein DRN70_03990 [Methanosarcinales archaeon]|nr:MAG: hypothetical protein DRN70_03990 [Methanosarcinales archaeon]
MNRFVGRDIGDKIEGERVVCEARSISKPVLIHRSGAHRAQRVKLTGNPVVCWVEKPFREKRTGGGSGG